MNVNKIFDKLPYGSLAPLKQIHFIGIAGLVAVVIFVGSWFAIFSPNQETKANLEKKLDDANKKLALYLREGAKKEAITKEVAALYGTLLEKKRQMPLASEIPQLLQKISDIGDFLGLDIVSYELEPTTDKGFYKSIPVSVTIAGSFYQTAGFFDSVQNLLRVVSVKNFAMDMKEGVQISIDEDGEAKSEPIDVLHTEVDVQAFAYIEGSEDATESKPEAK